MRRLASASLLTAGLLWLSLTPLLADDWSGWLGPQHDSVWRETGILKKFPEGGPSVRWRTPVGLGYSGPAVSDGRVFVLDRTLDASANNPADPFQRGVIKGNERLLCLEEKTGKILWEHAYECPYTVSYPAGPRAMPIVGGGKVYTLGAEGSLLCLNVTNGTVIWSKDFKQDYSVTTPMWGFAANPLLDGERLICVVGGSNTTAVAFDKNTGKELWHALSSKEPGYCAPTIIEAGGKRQLIVFHPQGVNSLNPENGEVYWTEPCNIRSGMTIPSPRKLDDLLYLTCFYNGSMMFRLDPSKPTASLIWKSKKVSEMDTDALHSTMSTPFLEGGYIYGVCSYGQLRCLKADTGERVWETLAATTKDGKPTRWANAFIVKQGDRFFLFNEKGDLIIANLNPQGYEEISRAHLLEPTNTSAYRNTVWTHPAYANRCVYVRNDKEVICVDLAEK